MPKHDYVEPYYMVQLCDDDLQEMQTYISKLKERDYRHEKIIHNNAFQLVNKHACVIKLRQGTVKSTPYALSSRAM